jgi:hypothetical protein
MQNQLYPRNQRIPQLEEERPYMLVFPPRRWPQLHIFCIDVEVSRFALDKHFRPESKT